MIIKAYTGDIALLNRISVASKKYWNYPEDWISHWMDELTLKEEDFHTQHIYKIESHDVAFGFCAIEEHEQEYEITHLWIEPGHIGKGYGHSLLKHTIREVVKKPKDIVVVSDPHAEAFYKSRGFITFDRVESYPEGRFLPKMKRKDSTRF